MRVTVIRQPTLKEAVDYIKKLLTKQGRSSAINHYRARYGNKFANDIETILIDKRK